MNRKKNALLATALQDHLIKDLKLNLNEPLGERKTINYKSSKPIIQKNKFNKKDNEKEFIVDDNKNTLSLAEKLGIIQAKTDHLNETQWQQVKNTSAKREDFKQPCVICKEHLGTQEQVLLSCTHIFHFKCLKAFEAYSGKKSCPMCRCSRYQKRVVFDGTKYFRDISAIKIQAAWRGYVVRKWYTNFQKNNPPKDKNLRKKYFQEKLTDLTERLVNSCNYENEDFLNEIDLNLAKSRSIFNQLTTKLNKIDDLQWVEIKKSALRRDNQECSICMMEFPNKEDMVSNKLKNNDSKQETPIKSKPIVLLSCSHIFHDVCLNMLEELNYDQISLCPICRSVYQKKI